MPLDDEAAAAAAAAATVLVAVMLLAVVELVQPKQSRMNFIPFFGCEQIVFACHIPGAHLELLPQHSLR